MINSYKEKLKVENQKVETPLAEIQSDKAYPAYEPPMAEVILFDNDYVRAIDDPEGPFTEGSTPYRHTGTTDCPMCHGMHCVPKQVSSDSKDSRDY